MGPGPDDIFNDDSTDYGEENVVNFFDDDTCSIILGEAQQPGLLDYEFEDDTLNDIDFSEMRGDFKSSLKKIDGKLKPRARVKKVPLKRKPLSRRVPVGGSATIHGQGHQKNAERIMVPKDRPVIVRGVDDFMLSTSPEIESFKNIGYYKGKKLKELVFIINNNSAIDFQVELFNPTMPLDYLFSNAGNINNKIQVAGGNAVMYTDVVYYLLANPTIIPSVRMVVSGPSVAQQQAESLIFKNKNIAGEQYIDPINLSQSLDVMQFQSQTISFDVPTQLGRPFIPDGMDVLRYTIKAGNTVTICFYYKQKKLKKLLWKEARDHKTLM